MIAKIDFHPGQKMQEKFRFWQGCPTVLCTPKGRLYAGWYTGGTTEPSLSNCNLLVRSDDNGASWSEPLLTISGDPEAWVVAIDIQLWRDPQDRMWLFWTQRDYAVDRHRPDHLQLWRMICEDPDAEHLQWGKPECIAPGFLRCQPTVLSDGRIMLCAYDWIGDHFHYSESSDGGVSWNRRCGGKKLPGSLFDESMIFEEKSGRLHLFARHSPFLTDSISDDSGTTWSDAAPTPWRSPGARFYIGRLPSGRVILIGNDDSQQRCNLTAFLSEDDGRTFPYKLVLDERINTSYPDLSMATDDSFYIVHDRCRMGEKEIMISRLTEEDIRSGELVSPQGFLRRIVSKAPREPFDPALFATCAEADKELNESLKVIEKAHLAHLRRQRLERNDAPVNSNPCRASLFE